LSRGRRSHTVARAPLDTDRGRDWGNHAVDAAAPDFECAPLSANGYASPVTDTPATPRNRIVTGRLVRMGEEEQVFDDAFWRSMTGEERVELLWQMVLDALAVKGIDGEPRLQRSVGSIRRP
jgi:hypothetical protein